VIDVENEILKLPITITESLAQEKIEEKQTETEDQLKKEKKESKQPAEVVEQERQDSDRARYILRTVRPDEAFYFYEGLDKPTGEFAESLLDFRNKIMTLQLSSVIFHLKRKDLEAWIRETIGDATLAEKISEVETNALVKMELQAIIDTRIIELKELLQNQPVTQKVAYPTLS
jgi:hypothetical protein